MQINIIGAVYLERVMFALVENHLLRQDQSSTAQVKRLKQKHINEINRTTSSQFNNARHITKSISAVKSLFSSDFSMEK